MKEWRPKTLSQINGLQFTFYLRITLTHMGHLLIHNGLSGIYYPGCSPFIEKARFPIQINFLLSLFTLFQKF